MMSTEKHQTFRVIEGAKPEIKKSEQKTINGQTNPFYERLVKFAGDSSRKRFTVEDLLR